MLLNIEDIIKIVGYEMKYSPLEISGLFLDRRDYEGLLFWYDAIVEINKPIKKDKK